MALSREELLDMFCQALDIKEKKKKLYEEAMQGCSDQVGRETFGLLMNAEMEHIRYLQEMYEDLKKGSDWSNACRYIPAEEQALKALYKRIRWFNPTWPELAPTR
jgi:rubrerythrin